MTIITIIIIVHHHHYYYAAIMVIILIISFSHFIIVYKSGKKHLWPFSFLEILRMALSAPASRKNPNEIISDEEISEIYEVLYTAGMESVKLWYEEQH